MDQEKQLNYEYFTLLCLLTYRWCYMTQDDNFQKSQLISTLGFYFFDDIIVS